MTANPGQKRRAVIEVVIGVLVDSRSAEPRVLIARRRDRSALGGMWELPGGKIEPGESPRQALVREFDEELGVRVEVGGAYEAIEHEYEHAAVRLHPFRCTLAAGESGAAQNRQVAEHRWAHAAELAATAFPPANAGLMRTIIAELRS